MVIEGLHVEAPPTSHNTDAIDINSCDTVIVRDCDLDEGDDNVSIKATEGPCANVLVENCRCLHGHGISIGSETYKGIHDVTVRDCTFDGTQNGIRIKSARDRGNDLYGFSFSNIKMTNVGNALTLNMYYMDKTAARNRVTAPVTEHTPKLHDVTIENVTATGVLTAGDITGLPEMDVKDVTLTNVNISANKGMTIRDAQQITVSCSLCSWRETGAAGAVMESQRKHLSTIRGARSKCRPHISKNVVWTLRLSLVGH